MADNHPTIDITKAPPGRLDCLNPVYNCVEYCFQMNDYVQQLATPATMFVLFNASNYADGITVTVGGKDFITETPQGAGSFSWQGTQGQISASFALMLNSDYYYGCNFVIQLIVGNIVQITALEPGEIPNFIAGTSFPVASPPLVAGTDGADLSVRENYRFVVEIWRCNNAGARLEKITTRNYIIDPNNTDICIDIASRLLQSLVSTTFPGLSASTTLAVDGTIKDTICLRFGEVYSDGSADCDVSPQWFEDTSPIDIVNSAFQKDNDDKMGPFCFELPNTEDQRFLTNRPQFAEVCTESFAWLWFQYDDFISLFIEPNPDLEMEAVVFFNYANGTTSEVVIGTFDISQGNEVVIVPSGLAQLSGLATPGLKVSSYSIRAGVRIAGTIFIPVSEEMNYKIADSGFCCCHEEFYFLSEPGGFDTILFNCLRGTDLEYQYAEFAGRESCEGSLLKGGRAEAEARAYEVHKTTTRFLDKYENLNWFREFLKSPKRYWRKNGKVYKILLLNDTVELRRKDELIFVELEYVLSFELNTQEN